MEQKQYVWFRIGFYEEWSNCRFDSIDECIQDAVKFGFKPGTRINIGITHDYEPGIDGYDILEQAEEDAYEECGDAALYWLSDYWKGQGRKEAEKLGKELNEVFKKWLLENNLWPNFYKVESTGKVITITEDGYEED
jgi:hypothetical protein